jgi:hypothetical protein
MNTKNKFKFKKKRSNKKIKKYQYQKGGNDFIDTNFERCYEQNLQKVINAIHEYSGKHSIDQEKAREFIDNQTSSIRREAAQNLIDNTIYITLQEVFDIIGELIDKVYSEINPNDTVYLYTYLPEKSFYFMCVIALYHIRLKGYNDPVFVKYLNADMFNNAKNSPVIILDDVSYSGSQLSNMLNSIYIDNVIKKKKPPPNIYVLLIALNEKSKFNISHSNYIKQISPGKYGYEKLPFKLIYLEERCYKPIISKIGIEKYIYMIILFSPWTISVKTPYVSIYLDHKIADENSTFTTTLIYGQIPPSSFNINKYNELKFRGIYYYHKDDDDDDIEGKMLLNNLDSKYKNDNGMIYINKLIENFIDQDISDRPQTTEISFKPFINLCNKNEILLENISNPEIKNMDYFIFMLPENCLNSSKDCVLSSSSDLLILLNNYLQINNLSIQDNNNDFDPETDKIQLTQEGENLIQIHNKIKNFKCPISWYKNGEFQMICISSDGGNKTKTRRRYKKNSKKKTK